LSKNRFSYRYFHFANKYYTLTLFSCQMPDSREYLSHIISLGNIVFRIFTPVFLSIIPSGRLLPETSGRQLLLSPSPPFPASRKKGHRYPASG